jgi:hypothetical protein
MTLRHYATLLPLILADDITLRHFIDDIDAITPLLTLRHYYYAAIAITLIIAIITPLLITPLRHYIT